MRVGFRKEPPKRNKSKNLSMLENDDFIPSMIRSKRAMKRLQSRKSYSIVMPQVEEQEKMKARHREYLHATMNNRTAHIRRKLLTLIDKVHQEEAYELANNLSKVKEELKAW